MIEVSELTKSYGRTRSGLPPAPLLERDLDPFAFPVYILFWA